MIIAIELLNNSLFPKNLLSMTRALNLYICDGRCVAIVDTKSPQEYCRILKQHSSIGVFDTVGGDKFDYITEDCTNKTLQLYKVNNNATNS